MIRPLVIGMGWFDNQPGGLNRYVADLRRALLSVETPARFLVTGPAPGAPDDVTVVGTAADPLPQRMAGFADAARAMASEVDVVDCHFAPYALLPVLGPLRRQPLLVHFHGPWADESRAVGDRRVGVVLKAAIERLVYRRAQMVAADSSAFRQLVVERYRVEPWRTRTIAPTTDLERFQPRSREQARRALGIDERLTVALAVRRLVPRTGVDLLLEAWAAVVDDPGWLLVIAGDGTQRDELEARARTLGIESSVRFLGRVPDDDVREWYTAADLTVVPTRELEGFGLIVLESLASGTPTLATDSGGLSETVSALDRGLVVPAGDVGALSRALGDRLSGRVPLPTADACRSFAVGFDQASFAANNEAAYRDVACPPRTRRPRVVYVDHCAGRSGGELAMARQLPALRVDAHVILGERGPLESELRGRGVSLEVMELSDRVGGVSRHEVIGRRLPGLAAPLVGAYTARLAARLARLRPDLVHTNSLKSAIYGGLAARLAGIPVIWHLRDRISDDYLPAPLARTVRWLARWLPSGVVANSAATLATLGPLSIPSTVVASPIDEPFATGDRNGGPLRVGVVGRLAEWKGQDLFLEAFARAFPDDRAEAVVVGGALFGADDQAFADALPALVDRLGLGGRVTFTGHVPDVRPQLSELDVVVHSSRIPEPFGQVVVEAMAAGLPVVAANAGGPAELITDGTDGLLYETGDIVALAEALRRLGADRDLRLRLGRDAVRRGGQFLPDALAGELERFYTLVATGAEVSG